jgi:hypothetical protein
MQGHAVQIVHYAALWSIRLQTAGMRFRRSAF